MRVAREIIRVSGSKKKKEIDRIAVELLLKIYLNKKRLVSISCSPEDLDYLVTGFLFSEGIVKDKSDIKNIKIEEGCCYVEVKESSFFCQKLWIKGSGCGTFFSSQQKLEKVSSPFFAISPDDVLFLMKEMEAFSKEYHLTGGVHSAGLSDGKKIIIFRQDIGRHNAIDKVIGESLIKGISFSDKILLTSGRISSEIVSKSAKCNISIIISKSAPTSYAIKLAEFYEITLVGFARGKRFNIYCHHERIV
ncbi:MAG: formate dehydrogenase accessory sulfurtransferase FdhD [Candidatus Omnitrophica bacterium]|nr:formate dehydrogenase accessory sulfurtransferase FdhD [Candidatus Omnitrophota bacterium]